MDAENPHEERDEPQIEMSDMRPRPVVDRTRVPWYAQRVELPRPLLAALVAALLALALLVVLSAGGQLAALIAHPAAAATATHIPFPTAAPTPTSPPTPTPYPTPTLIAPVIGPVPADCPSETTLVAFDPAAVSSGIGGSNVWLVAPFSGSHAVLHLSSYQPKDYTPYGWSVLVQLLIKPDFGPSITLTGSDLRTRYPLWLTSSNSNMPISVVPNVTIDPTRINSGTSDGLWSIWFGVLYLPGAGCYTMRASWSGGGWTANFAAGA